MSIGIASSPAKTQNPKSNTRIAVLVTASEPAETTRPADEPPARERQRTRAAGVRLWGFVRRQQDMREPTPALLTQDIAIWHDRKRGRFQVVSDEKVVDDLAPIEFVQFVRALRYSAVQKLFKYENQHDGTAGRAVMVWATP